MKCKISGDYIVLSLRASGRPAETSVTRTPAKTGRNLAVKIQRWETSEIFSGDSVSALMTDLFVSVEILTGKGSSVILVSQVSLCRVY